MFNGFFITSLVTRPGIKEFVLECIDWNRVWTPQTTLTRVVATLARALRNILHVLCR